MDYITFKLLLILIKPKLPQQLPISNNQKITPSPKGFINPFGKALFYANFINGALKTAPCTPSKAFKQQGGSPCQSKSQTL